MIRINITIDEKTLKLLDEMAKENGLSRSSFIRLLIHQNKSKN